MPHRTRLSLALRPPLLGVVALLLAAAPALAAVQVVDCVAGPFFDIGQFTLIPDYVFNDAGSHEIEVRVDLDPSDPLRDRQMAENNENVRFLPQIEAARRVVERLRADGAVKDDRPVHLDDQVPVAVDVVAHDKL